MQDLNVLLLAVFLALIFPFFRGREFNNFEIEISVGFILNWSCLIYRMKTAHRVVFSTHGVIYASFRFS